MGKKKCIIKRPDEKYGHVTSISTSLENLQKTVDGPIEIMPIRYGETELLLIVNEEGKLRGLEPSFPMSVESYGHIYADLIVGNCIVIGGMDEGLVDVPITFDEWKNMLDEWR